MLNILKEILSIYDAKPILQLVKLILLSVGTEKHTTTIWTGYMLKNLSYLIPILRAYNQIGQNIKMYKREVSA